MADTILALQAIVSRGWGRSFTDKRRKVYRILANYVNPETRQVCCRPFESALKGKHAPWEPYVPHSATHRELKAMAIQWRVEGYRAVQEHEKQSYGGHYESA